MNIKNEAISVRTLQEQLYSVIYQQIQDGILKPGDKILSEEKLCEKYNVSRVTVRSALKKLADQNYLIKRKGKGTFVSSIIHTESVLTGGSFTETSLQMGKQPTTEIIKVDDSKTPIRILNQLGSESIIEVERLRSVDETPVILEYDYFPQNYLFVKSEHFLHHSFLRGIEKELAVKLRYFEDHFQMIYANKEVSDKLQCALGTPLLEVTQSVLDQSRNLIYINRQCILTSKYIYAVEYEK